MDYNLTKVNIADGVNAVIADTSGFKTAQISFSFACNLSRSNGEYALLSKMILRSSEDYSDFTEISRRLAELYGATLSSSVMKIGEQQVVKISISFIEDCFALDGESIAESCIKLLSDLIFRPNIKNGAFDLQETESEKRLLLQQIESEKNDKALYARLRLEQTMFKEELYCLNKYGDAQSIEKITPDIAAKAYLEYLKRAVIRVNIIGKFDFEKALTHLKERFALVERSPEKIKTEFIPSGGDVKYESEADSVNQGKLVMGFRAGMADCDDNYYATRVMTDLFGGGTYSKLFKVVREEMSLCYYCSARLISQKGVIFVQSGIDTENEEKAKNAILKQLEDIKVGNFKDEDLQSSIDSLVNRFGTVSDTPEDLDDWFSQQIVTDEVKKPSEYEQSIKKVARDDVIFAAQRVTLDTMFMLKGTESGEEKTDA